jgi:hypothetical protein
MTEENHSVVLCYDEKTDKLSVFSIPSAQALQLKDSQGFEIPLNDFRALNHDDVEQRVGAGLLQLLDSFSNHKLGLRDYVSEFETALQNMIDDGEKEAASGDPQAQHNLALLYRDLAVRRKSSEILSKSKQLEELAAAQGLPGAARNLEFWYAFERQLAR